MGDYSRKIIARKEGEMVDVERLRQDRVAAWQRIQRDAPDVAALMAEVRRVFGARAGVGAVVEIGGERVWPVEVET